jgi:hypothetical protein
MSNQFLQYWKPAQIDYALEKGASADHAGSGQYRRMKVMPGDTVWIVTTRFPGELVTIGRIYVGEIISRREAIKRFGEEEVWDAEDHIVAEPGTEEKFQELSLMDIAEQLRFHGKSGRLKILDGLVPAQQLQAIRKLTPASILLLESEWNVDRLPSAPEIEHQISKAGAGYGDPETNREVERAAIKFVTEWYEERGWNVKSVEAMKCGYDLRCTNQTKEEDVEVKGVQGTGQSFIITANEVREARDNANFVICIVNSALSSNRQMTRYNGKDLIEKFELIELAYRASLRE